MFSRNREITLVGTGQIAALSGGGDITLTFNVAPKQGDMVLAFGTYQGTGGTGTASFVTSGYTTRFSQFSGNARGIVATKFMGGTPDATVTLNVDQTSGSRCFGCYVFENVHADVLDAAVTEATGNSTNPDAPSITTATAGALVVPIAFSHSGDNAVTAPSGYGNAINIGISAFRDTSLAAAMLAAGPPGAVNPPSWTNWTAEEWRALTLALKPA
jgi:hypothetical protein